MTTSIPTITIVGNLVADPELRFTASGKAVASLRVAVSERVKDGDQWKDGDSTYWRVSAWDGLAEHIGDSLAKGQRVIVMGRVASRTWETKEGEKREQMEITADAVGPDLKWATAKVERVGKGGSSRSSTPADDPWSASSKGLDDLAEIPF
jgi:single-strand DNA-binding protein